MNFMELKKYVKINAIVMKKIVKLSSKEYNEG